MGRVFDITVALLALVLLFPLMLVITVAIWVFLGSPAIFRQKRPGIYGEPFEMIKFRTMRDGFDEQGSALPDVVRITRLGKLLRSLSLDELPELWNVLNGDMSLVGPRPLLMEYLPLYSEEQSRRHEVRPGITGWAQINGRNAISWEEKFELDVWYVENKSFWLDMKILWLTVFKVFHREGINQGGNVTMEKFKGSSS